MQNKTAVVFGSTGLIGNLLLEELVGNDKYSLIKSFVRQPTGITEPRVTEIVTDFADVSVLAGQMTGDDLFICLGTTIRKAGSISNMEKIDRDLPVEIARTALHAGIKAVAVVSSIGAASNSPNYYLRIKGEMEAGILVLPFEKRAIVRPSMLLGERKEKRTGEFVGKVVMSAFKPVLTGKLRKYRAIHGRDVARAMIAILNGQFEKVIFESDDLQRIAESQN